MADVLSASSRPALSELSESLVRSCRATSDRVGHRNNAAGRPRRGAGAGPAGRTAAGRHIHPSGERLSDLRTLPRRNLVSLIQFKFMFAAV